MKVEDLASRIHALFCGSGRYAIQQPDGSYLAAKKGGEWLPLTPEVVRDHLLGKKTVGAYQIRAQDNTVSWACFDIDGTEGTEVALRALYQTVIRECPKGGRAGGEEPEGLSPLGPLQSPRFPPPSPTPRVLGGKV